MSPGLRLLLAFLILATGLGLVLGRRWLARHATRLYHRLGLEVPEDDYARQFYFIGILTMVLGFLLATGLLETLY